MDRDLVYVLLLVAVVATLVVLLAAIWSVRRRTVGSRNNEPRGAGPDALRVAGAADLSAAVPTETPPISDHPAPDLGRDGSEPDDAPELEALVDPVTRLGARQAWVEALRNEERRLARYRHPATILVAELHGLDALAERLGQDAADRLIPPVADAMRRNARDADLLTRVGHVRFFAILPETDEIAAINYVERVRSACDMWLEAGAVTVRLAIGWASPPAGGTLSDALGLAEERMNAARPSRGGQPARGPSARSLAERRSADESPASPSGPEQAPSVGPTAEGSPTPS